MRSYVHFGDRSSFAPKVEAAFNLSALVRQPDFVIFGVVA
jgi:hypothetical protein